MDSRTPFVSRRIHLRLGWLMVTAVVFLSLIPVPELPEVTTGYDDKIGHVLIYAAIMAWFAWVMPRARWVPLAFAVLGLGIGLEFCQALLPYRSASLADALANTLGVALGTAAASIPLSCDAGSPPRGRAE